MRLVALGDQAALASFEDEQSALRFAVLVRRVRPCWLVDVVPAYATVAVFFDLDQITFGAVTESLRDLVQQSSAEPLSPLGQRYCIPCCYEFQQDLARVADHIGLSPEQVIELHAGTEYTVHAIGFCPGFPYLGYLPPALAGVPRLPSPRLRVEPGSVGLTGRQTGIYTEARPGGWNLIGRTPLALVDVAENYFPLRAGDRVRFARIDSDEYRRLQGQRLERADPPEPA